MIHKATVTIEGKRSDVNNVLLDIMSKDPVIVMGNVIREDTGDNNGAAAHIRVRGKAKSVRPEKRFANHKDARWTIQNLKKVLDTDATAKAMGYADAAELEKHSFLSGSLGNSVRRTLVRNRYAARLLAARKKEAMK